MNIDGKIKDCECNLKQIKHFDPDPYYVNYFFKAYLQSVIDVYNEILAGADVVVTASGSTVLESAIVYKKPTIISYNPEWTRTAKYEDILMLSKKVNGVLLEEFSHKTLMDAIEKARKQKPPEIKSGAGKLSERILELAEGL
jgi:UDP-N-acetylglucosamine:LPS N-acetylglucosamine transferase